MELIKITEKLLLVRCKGNKLPECNIYAVLYSKGSFLIDCGNGFSAKEMIEKFREMKHPITHIFLTHCHFDHSLGAGIFKKEDVKIISHINTAIALKSEVFRVWYEHPERVKPVEVDIELKDEEEVHIEEMKIKAIYTPGHTSGSMSYLIEIEGKRCLFTGDLIAEEGELPWAGSIDFDMERVISSLEKVDKIDFDYLFGGHWYSLKEGKKWIEEGIEKGKRGKWKIDKSFKEYSVEELRND
ncbi:MBL fold metallo-hydrolase [bacterium]|nr:MBL fold metallo-hydrolase [bacterium]